LYLYGIVAYPMALPAHLEAVEDGTSVDLIADAGIACVVSSVRARDYHSSVIGRTTSEQLQWVTPRAWRHHDIVRQLQARTAVIPLKFGTLCNSADDVRDMLARRRMAIAALLGRLAGKDEWTLTIRVDRERVAALVERTDSDLLALGAEEQVLRDGRAYFARKKRQRRLEDLLASHMSSITQMVHERLGNLVDVCAVEHTQASGAALLVERLRFSALTQSLADLETEHAVCGLSLELSGPWAPYSFVTDCLDGRELTSASGIDSRPRFD
jgi:hypothetical protein